MPFPYSLANESIQYARYDTDMQRVMHLYDKCDHAECFGIAYAVVQNTNATPELIESVANRSPEQITTICLAIDNPCVSKVFIEK